MGAFENVCEYIEKNKETLIELEKLLTKIPAISPESGGNGESEKCAALEQWLAAHGIDNLEHFDAPDSRVSSGVRPNLVATIAGKTSRKLWIMSHLDVVPVGEISLWNTEPFEVMQKDGKLFGRGVEDDQQGAVCSIMAVLALKALGIMPEYTVKLLFVADEEVGSNYGIHYIIKNYNLFDKDDLIITPDGGDPKGETIEVAEKNILWLKVQTHGKQTHGSTPDEGINAKLASCALALKINALEKELDKRDSLFAPDRSTLQPTKQEANVPNVNTIPGDDIMYFDCRILPVYSLDFVREKIKKCCDEIASQYGVTFTVSEEQASESPATPEDCEVVKVLEGAVRRVLNLEPRIVGIGGGTVAACLRSVGFNAVVWSKHDETMHQPNEYCIIQNLIDESNVLASVMMKNA